jgi:hypothetical protein
MSTQKSATKIIQGEQGLKMKSGAMGQEDRWAVHKREAMTEAKSFSSVRSGLVALALGAWTSSDLSAPPAVFSSSILNSCSPRQTLLRRGECGYRAGFCSRTTCRVLPSTPLTT